MAKIDKLNLSESDYVQRMDRLTMKYSGHMAEAERINSGNMGRESKAEAVCYNEAAKVCEEIKNMNLGQRAVYDQWEQRRRMCVACVKRIVEALSPAKQPEAPEVKNARGQDGGSTGQPGGHAATGSGFTTKNATKDVPAETIESWYKDKPRHDFDDVTGMEELKKRLFDEVGNFGWTEIDQALGISPVQCYFFYGPPGTGKTYLIEAFASELMEKGFKYLHLLGGDIHASLVGVAEKTVQTAFKEAIDSEPCLIFIDEVEGVCVDRDGDNVQGHEKRLTNAFLEARNLLLGSGKRVVFMGATNHPGKVDSAMLDSVKLIRIPLPDEKAREAYFARKFSAITLDESLTFEDMARATDNYSYRDLNRLTDSMSIELKNRAIEQYKVETDGAVDQKRTDMAGSAALRGGAIQLTRDVFDLSISRNLPSDKSRILTELEEFEKKVSSLYE